MKMSRVRILQPAPKQTLWGYGGMVDTLDLGSSAAMREGSSPFIPTKITGVLSGNVSNLKGANPLLLPSFGD